MLCEGIQLIYHSENIHDARGHLWIKASSCILGLLGVCPAIQIVNPVKVIAAGPDIIERALRSVFDCVMVRFTELWLSSAFDWKVTNAAS